VSATTTWPQKASILAKNNWARSISNRIPPVGSTYNKEEERTRNQPKPPTGETRISFYKNKEDIEYTE
jgi:hypothetical protein